MKFEADKLDAERKISRAELSRHDGEQEPAYIAYLGVVYDISRCPKWRTGLHEFMHFPGQDLTAMLKDAPHGEEVFRHPCVYRVGFLSDDDKINL